MHYCTVLYAIQRSRYWMHHHQRFQLELACAKQKLVKVPNINLYSYRTVLLEVITVLVPVAASPDSPYLRLILGVLPGFSQAVSFRLLLGFHP